MLYDSRHSGRSTADEPMDGRGRVLPGARTETRNPVPIGAAAFPNPWVSRNRTDWIPRRLFPMPLYLLHPCSRAFAGMTER